jgi:hypothetical protein
MVRTFSDLILASTDQAGCSLNLLSTMDSSLELEEYTRMVSPRNVLSIALEFSLLLSG